MIHANYAMLTSLLSAIPHYRFDTEMISNIQEAIGILEVNTKDTRERELIECIKTMCSFIKNGIDYDADTLIMHSTPDEKTANDIMAKCAIMPDVQLTYLRQYISTIVTEKEVFQSLENLHKRLEGVATASNHKVAEAMQKLGDEVKRIVFAIDQKVAKKQSKILTFGRKKLKGMDQVIHQLRHEEKNVLSCGVDAIDELTGKFKPSKLYTTIALTGGFKSGYLENCTLGIAKNNPTMEKIPNLENAVLHITFENDILQIFKRFIDYHMDEKFFSRRKLPHMTDEEIVALAQDKLSPKTDDEMEIIVQQFARYTVRPDELLSVVAQHRRDGKRIVAIVLDYADLMSPPLMNEFEYEDKAKMPIVRKFEELKLIAQQLQIPIITAGQFNRTGEYEAKRAIQSSKLPSPLMGTLNGSNIAGGYALKFHVESLIIQYRGNYNGVNLLHLLLDKDRDGEGNESTDSTVLNQMNGNYRFIKFLKNDFRISPFEKDAYKDIRDVQPLNDGGIVSAAFETTKLATQTVNELEEREESRIKILDSL